MIFKISRKFLLCVVTVSLMSIGFSSPSMADIISTQDLIDNEHRRATITRMESILARDDVAEQLIAFGVQPEAVVDRLNNMTHAELLALDGSFDKHISGGDAVSIIGAVFLVLLVLELVGVTDIFKAI